MDLAICKIGANITFSTSNKSAANADILYFLRQLGVDKHSVTIHTHKTRNTFIPKRIGFKEIQETQSFNDYDCVLVFNGSINFFGGAPDPNLFALYRALAKTEKRIIYVNTDGALPFKQLWPLIRHRDWAKEMTETEFHIAPDSVAYLTQGRDYNKMTDLFLLKPENIYPSAVLHYPLYKTILAKADQYISQNMMLWSDRPFDLGFGGYTRNTYKRKRIEHYYDSPTLNTLLFGNLRGLNVRNTKVRPKVSYQQFINKMKYCKATVIVGDKYYEDHFFTLRMYESLLADNMVFIDERLDTCHEFYALDSSFYVNSLRDIEITPRKYIEWTRLRNLILEAYDYDYEQSMLESCIETVL